MASKQHHYFAPILRRIIKLWLPLFGVAMLMVYVSQWRYDAKREAQYGLDRVNFWRQTVGLDVLQENDLLTQSARNHAHYLTYAAEGHEENDSSIPFYTGKTAQNRATYVGYPSPIAENLTISNWARSGKNSVDGLMTALYHRLSLLNPQHDEAGAAWARKRNHAFVINQGNSQERILCSRVSSFNEFSQYRLSMHCMDQEVSLSLDDLNDLPKEYLKPVKFPMGNEVEPIYNGKEYPNPIPDKKETGNPISVAFYGRQSPIRLISFKLFSPKGQIQRVRLLTADNDPNGLLNENEFALFSLEKLQFDTPYRVEFLYEQNQQQHREEWTFRTRKRRDWFEW